MPKKIHLIAAREGHCCIYSLITSSTLTGGQEATRLGLDRSTINYWRRKVKDNRLCCLKVPGCSESLPQETQLESPQTSTETSSPEQGPSPAEHHSSGGKW